MWQWWGEFGGGSWSVRPDLTVGAAVCRVWGLLQHLAFQRSMSDKEFKGWLILSLLSFFDEVWPRVYAFHTCTADSSKISALVLWKAMSDEASPPSPLASRLVPLQNTPPALSTLNSLPASDL